MRRAAWLCLVLVGAAAPAAAATFSLGGAALVQRPDLSREAWRWDTSPRAAWSAEAMLGTGRLEAGARYMRLAASQSLGLEAPAPATAALHGDSYEVLARGEIARVAGFTLDVRAAAGRTRWAWTPDHVTVVSGASSTDVRLAPFVAPTAAAGLAVGTRAGAWALRGALERRWSRFETAHRSGDTVVLGHDTFGDWQARLEVARVWTLAAKGTAR